MQLVMTADEAAVRQVVGTETFLRGREYARRGAVLNTQWREEDQHVYGQVRGTARAPYTAIAVVAKSTDGALTSFRGTCTCPVGTNCKHAVALLLAALPADEPARGAVADAPPAPWERALLPLVRDETRELPQPGIALQFELSMPAARGSRAATRLGLRPVVPGKNGGWVRTGTSWSNLAYLSYSHRQIAQEHLRLLGEILAMSAGGQSMHYYGSASQTIFLDSIGSRRIWDLLAEARTLGLPLVQTGKQAAPVTVHQSAAEVVLDLSRTATGVELRPRLTVAGLPVELGSALLIGEQAHGVAWWPADDSTQRTGCVDLQLARLGTPLDPTLRALLVRGALRVPRRDESRFFAQFYPALQQRVRVASADESVELPEAQPPALILSVQHLDGHRLSLEWQWRYALGDQSRREPLWPLHSRARGRDLEQEAAGLRPVLAVTGSATELWEATSEGVRLAPAVALDGIETVRFSTDVLPRLAELPELTIETYGTPTSYREAESAPVVAFAGEQSADDRDWFDLAVTVSVDGQDVAFESLFVALSSGQSHLILPSGTYFTLDRPEFRALAELIAEARALQDHSPGTVRLSRFQASLWDELDQLGVISGQAPQWQRSARALTQAAELAEQPVPQTLRAELRPYQHAGFNWLAFLYANELGGILADEMGLGKTVQTLALICHVKQQPGGSAPFLVVAPTSVASNWAAECRKFAPDLAVEVIVETGRRRGRELAEIASGADIVITSYTLFRLEHDDYAALDWAGLVLDEAQFVKNHQSRGYQCAKKLAAPFKLAITGTPMENNLMELWSLLSITAPGLFASPSRFEQQYRTPIENGRNTERLDRLRRRVKPLMLRRSKEQVVRDLPDKQEQVLELALNPKHRRIYQTHLQRERQKVLGLLGDLEKNRFEIFRSLTLLRQASLDVALIDPAYANVPSTKLDALMELLDETVSEGHRTLVFSQFTRFLSAARRRLDEAGIDYCYLDGKTRNRAAVLAEFKDGAAPVFLISLKAGGFGLNLTEADYCVLLDPWWNPATEAQAVDRIHRIGQTKKVMVYRLVASETIEQKVMALKAAKAALFGSVMDGGEFSSAALTAADIRGMLE